MDNPIRTIYDDIWDCIDAGPLCVELFPVNTVHQVRYDSALDYATDPDDQELAPADYPRLRITMHSAAPETESDSNGTYLKVVYQFEVCTGQMAQGPLMDATWAIFCALHRWHTKVRTIAWEGQYPVLDVDSKQIDFTDKNKERNRSTNQWIAVWAVEVTMRFLTATIKEL